MNEPVIIEVTRSEGDNAIGFSLRGSVEWMEEMKDFLHSNLTLIVGRMNKTMSKEQRTEMLAAIAAMQNRQSYQGQFVTVTINQEQPQ